MSSTTTTKASKAAVLAQLQALVSGLQKQLPNGSFTLVSTAYTTATLVQALQGLIAALTAVTRHKLASRRRWSHGMRRKRRWARSFWP